MRETSRTTKRELYEENKDTILKNKVIVQTAFEIHRGATLKIADGNERMGFVLTSDDNGNAIWKEGARTPADPKNSIQFNNERNIDGNEEFTFVAKTKSLSIGLRSPNNKHGVNSFVHGTLNTALGTSTHAQGQGTCAVADYSHTEGFKTIAHGIFSHAEGHCTETAGEGSHAESFCTFSHGRFSHAEGHRTRSRADFSHSEGRLTFSCGGYSHSEGDETISNAKFSHSEGQKTQANHIAAHSEGIHTIAKGEGSHSQGHFTEANASASFSSGKGVGGRPILSNGIASFNHSENTKKQIDGSGANADRSAILGGINHNIEGDNENAVIIGGEAIKLSGNKYINYTAMDNLALFKKPVDGLDDNILTWNPTSKKVGKVTLLASADARTVTNMVRKENILNDVYALNLYEYENNSNVSPNSIIGKKTYGLLAQEVERNFPLAVKEIIEYNGKKYKGIDNPAMIAILVQAIKELKNLINEQNLIINELSL